MAKKIDKNELEKIEKYLIKNKDILKWIPL